ncbi:hypothetical protein [Mycobacterium sp. Lab-001]|uniref:hypothetical protein n=1 Tax=Mycobacterium sp. Lab-001 TaxID=3410136 RepID=UPI003D1856B0
MGYWISDASQASAQGGGSLWSDALFIVGAGVAFVTVSLSAFARDPAVERRLYWSGWLIATLSICLGILPRGWSTSLGAGLLFMFVAVLSAYMQAPLLKIGGRIFAVTTNCEESDPSASDTARDPSAPSPRRSDPMAIGHVPARNLWWILAASTCIVSVGVYLAGWAWQMTLATVFLAVVGALNGIDDGTRKFPIARGQNIQAFVVAVASILLWLAPPVCYCLGYVIGQRYPMGRGKHTVPPPVAR